MRTTFYVLTGGCLSGVAIRSIFDMGVAEILTLCLLGACLFCAWFFLSSISILGYFTLFVCAFLLGAVRTEIAFHQHETKMVFDNESSYEGMGVVTAEPDVRDEFTIIYVRLDNNVETCIRVKTPHYPYIAYGERVHVKGTLIVPSSFTTETGRIFNYEGFLMKDGVQYDLREATVQPQGQFKGSALYASLITLKSSWLGTINESMSEPSASLLGGVIMGAKRSLGEKWLEAFRDTGLIHIVVLSGYNLTLVANGVVRATAFLPQLARAGFGSLGVVAFAILVGGGATVVRASAMAILGMLAPLVQRPYILIRALLFAGLLMSMWNPFSLLFDAGFQLSFIATAGLVLIAPEFEKYLSWVPEVWGVRGIVSATLATQLAVLPLLLYHIGTVSLVAPIVNVLVLPLIPLVMASGALAGFLGMMSTFVAYPFTILSYGVLTYIFFVVETCATLPFAIATVPAVSWYVLVFVYLCMAYLLYIIKKPACSAGEGISSW